MLEKNKIIFLPLVAFGFSMFIVSGICGGKLTFLFSIQTFKYLIDTVFVAKINLPIPQVIYGCFTMALGYILFFWFLKKAINIPLLIIKNSVFVRPIRLFFFYCIFLGFLLGIGNAGLLITFINMVNL